ncbi:MAG TPA: PAS domain S-box protein, partial [Thermoanaerobaculia bacterium]|nr:PAS domain S-box protein [Thermoanaerobaculia bacterium]
MGRARIAGEKGSAIQNAGSSGASDLRLRCIAAISQSAIDTRDLTAFLDETVLTIAETLRVECCAILECLPAGDVRLRAGVGCQERHHSPRGGIVDEVEVNVGERDRPWGVLAVHSARAGSVGAESREFLRSAANLIALAIGRRDLQAVQPRSSELLQTIFEESPMMISFRDPAGHLLYVNRAWEKTLGWTLHEARNHDFFQTVYPDPEARREAWEFMERCDRQWTDFRMQSRYGKRIDISWARFRLSDQSTIGFGLDVTDRRKAERALADSESRFAKLFQATPVALGISTVDEGRIVDVNESWLEMFGYQRDEVIGRTNAELQITVWPMRSETVQRLRAGEQIRNLELQVRRKSGELLDLIISVVPVVLSGEKDTWLAAQVDITGRKRAEAERDRLLESEKAARAEAESALERLRAIESITDTALQNLGLDELLQELLERVRGAVNAD